MRRYLLGQLSEENEELIEERLLADDDYFEQLEVTENELIDEYVHGTLTQAERELVEGRFLRAPERQRKLAFAVALDEESRARSKKVVPLRPRTGSHAPSFYLKAAAAVIIVVGLSAAAWWLLAGRTDVARGMVALNAAHKEQRLIEARVSGIDFAPIKQMRGGEQPKVDYTSRDLAEKLLLEAVNERRDAASYHALGRLYLAERKFDRAQDQFEKALSLSPDDARLHSDMGALLLEMGEAAQQNSGDGAPEYFGKSLEHFDRALKLEPSLPEALFNRALLYQRMSLAQQAREAWRAYLEKDSTSPWADEARRNLKLLEEQGGNTSLQGDRLYESFAGAYRSGDPEAAWAALRRGRSRAGNTVVEHLLDDYLDRAEHGLAGEAADILRMISYAGELESGRVGDRYTSDLAAAYGSAGVGQRKALAHARLLKHQGIEQYNGSEFEEAIALFTEAARGFESVGDGCEALLAECWLGYCELRIPEVKRSRGRFERMSKTFEERGYLSLLAQSLHALGDAQTSEDELSLVLDYAGRALEVSKRIQDDVTSLRCLQLFVSMHLKLGNYAESLKYGYEALRLAQIVPFDPKLVWTFYHEAALDFYWLRLMAAAFDFEKEALSLAEESKWPLIISRSHSRLGVIQEARGEYDEAVRSGLRSIEAGRNVEGEKSRLTILSHASLRMGHLYRQGGDFDKALVSYDEAMRMFERLGLGIYLYETRKGRFLALSGRGDNAAAEQELTETLRLFEQYRAKILEERNRNAFFDAGQDTYDLATDFAYTKQGDAERAFDYAETSRARSLLNLQHASPQITEGADGTDIKTPFVTSPLPLSEIRGQLPERAQLLFYSVLGDKLIAWVITREGVKSHAQPVSADEIDRKVATYMRLVANDDTGNGDREAAARELYAILIGPVENWLDEGKELFIVPDKALSHLPYNSLVSPATGRFLIEKYDIVISPSASVFSACTEAARKLNGTRDERLLSVGNPRFSRQRFPDLPNLPSAEREAEQVASCYNSVPLLGAQARESRVRDAMHSADVIHLASHYVTDERSPLLSELLLADEGGGSNARPDGDGVLRASEIYEMKLPRTRLVVLSACQTGVEQTLRGEGAIGLARPFISAGVPLVVASLWPVESDSTADLMVKFHRYRKQGGLSSAEALRRAQLDMIRDDDASKREPHAWASFAAFGGYAEF